MPCGKKRRFSPAARSALHSQRPVCGQDCSEAAVVPNGRLLCGATGLGDGSDEGVGELTGRTRIELTIESKSSMACLSESVGGRSSKS